MRIYSPPGYVRLFDGRRELATRMRRAVPPSENVEALRSKGYQVEDGTYAKLAAGALRRAIRYGDLSLYAYVPSRGVPIRLDKEIYDAAFTFEPDTDDDLPNDRQDRLARSSVLTLAYIDRHAGAPFGLSWPELRELMHAGLYFEEAEFEGWLAKEEKKEVWPSHEHRGEARSPGDQSKSGRVRARAVEDDAKLRNRIESVLATARRRWKPGKRPSARYMAKILSAENGQQQDFSKESLRKILTGKYPPMKSLGLKGLTG